MQITVNSKYEIGQQVYLCKTKLKFKDGDFVNASVPNLNPFTVTSIRIHQHPNSQSIYYRLDGLQNLFEKIRFLNLLKQLKILS